MNQVYKYRLEKNSSYEMCKNAIGSRMNVNGIDICFSEAESEYEADMSVLQYADRLIDHIDPDKKYRNLYEYTKDENAAVLTFYKYTWSVVNDVDHSENLTIFIKEDDGIEITMVSTGEAIVDSDSLVSRAEHFLDIYKFKLAG